MAVNVKEEKQNDIVICRLDGEININNSPDLRKAFEQIIKRNEKKVLADFSSVSYIDSSGLATLVEMFQRLKKIGGRLRFCGMDQKIKNIFEVTKLHKLFEIIDTKEEALKDF
jgi:anti-sigma B factor antagonist